MPPPRYCSSTGNSPTYADGNKKSASASKWSDLESHLLIQRCGLSSTVDCDGNGIIDPLASTNRKWVSSVSTKIFRSN